MRKRVDKNQNEIIKLYRQIGAGVVVLSDIGNGVTDILVGYQGKNYLVEIKNPNRKWKYTDKQKIWHESWPGQKAVIETKEDALKVIGII